MMDWILNKLFPSINAAKRRGYIDGFKRGQTECFHEREKAIKKHGYEEGYEIGYEEGFAYSQSLKNEQAICSTRVEADMKIFEALTQLREAFEKQIREERGNEKQTD